MSRSEGHSNSGLGDAAVAELVSRHKQFLDFVSARVANRSEAEDLLQEAFARGLEKGGALESDESVVAWFYRLLRNAVIDHYRRQSATRTALELQPRDPAIEPEFEAALEEAACQCVLSALEGMKPEYAQILRDVDVSERPIAEVAAAGGIAAGNARVRLHRARTALRERVEGICRTCATHGCMDCTCQKRSV